MDCRALLCSRPQADAIIEFLVQIVCNSNSEGYGSAFMGGVMTENKISICNMNRALNCAVKKLDPASVEHAAALHALTIIKSCLKLNGRHTDTFLKKTVPCLIWYLDFHLCDEQQTITEGIQHHIQQIRKSQTDLQLNQQTLTGALRALEEYVEAPSNEMKCQFTVNALNEALENAEDEQLGLLETAVDLAEKLNGVYGDKPLGQHAQTCLDAHNLFLAIITPFIYPFEFSWDDLLKQMGLVDGKLHQLALLLTDETHGLN